MGWIDELNWNDVRIFLGAMRSSSLRDVAERLGISHATAGRRLTAFETQLGVQLFDRRADGLHPRPEASQIALAAEEVERAMLGLERVAHAADAELRGTIHVTMPESVANHLLMPDLVRFSRRWPELDLRIIPTSRLSSLERREADVAIRLKHPGALPAEDLVGRRAATMYRAVYGVSEDAWIGWVDAPPVLASEVAPEYAELPVVGNFPDMSLQLAACQAGLGLAWLPCFLGDGALPRRSEPIPAADIWVVVHPDLRHSAKLRVLRDAMVEALACHQDRLLGVRLAPHDSEPKEPGSGA